MLRIARAVLFAAVPAELLVVILLISGASLPVWAIVAVEVLVLAVFTLEAVAFARLYGAERRSGATRKGALLGAYRQLVPIQVRRLMAFDVKGMVSLALWLTGRRHGVPKDATAVPYFGAQAPALLVFLGAMVVELFVVEVVLRHVGAPFVLRVVLLVLDGYSILLALAVIASCVVRPHVVSGGEVRIRSGAFFDLRIPRGTVVSARPIRGYNEQGSIRVDGTTLTVAVSSQVNVEVTLTGPVTAVRPLGREHRVDKVRLFADDPKRMIDAIESGYAPADDDSRSDADVQRPLLR